MDKLSIGDLTRIKMFGDEHYYVVIDVIDLTQSEHEEDIIEYDIVLVYPITANPVTESLQHRELELVAGFETDGYWGVMEYIVKERVRFNFIPLPRTVRQAIMEEAKKAGKNITQNGVKVHAKGHHKERVQPPSMIVDVEKILNDDTTDKEMALLVKSMDTHLDLLSVAMSQGNDELIKSTKEDLTEIRQLLMELEYFPL